METQEENALATNLATGLTIKKKKLENDSVPEEDSVDNNKEKVNIGHWKQQQLDSR